MAIRILDVGQCGFDGPRMASLFRDELGAKVDQCDFGEEAVEMVGKHKYNVILVNRLLAADGSSGLDVVKSLIDAGTHAPVMLVSDLDEAQDAAVALGAKRGFGKSDLGEPSTLALIERVAAQK